MKRKHENSPEEALQRIKSGHQAVLETAEALERATRPQQGAIQVTELRALADRLAEEFGASASLEDGVLRSFLSGPLPDSPMSIRQLELERSELNAMLDALKKTLDLPPRKDRDEQLRVQAQDLVALLRAQVRKEETLVFAIAARRSPRRPSVSSTKRHPPGGKQP